ncbi:MAG TPA: hypothetical protein PKA41_06270, partial [Verrucomicrobiota bacterium]|nr:hypothetical protein [Verrucomicrobiota bacterium]
EIAPYGHPDFTPKLMGRSINVMISPLPRNKRAKHPNQSAENHPPSVAAHSSADHSTGKTVAVKRADGAKADGDFANNPFAKIEVAASQPGEA